MFIHKNVLKDKNAISPGSPRPKSPNVTIIMTDDILSEPVRNNGGVKMEGNYTLKPGAKPIQVYMTPSTQAPSFEGDGDEDSVSIAQIFAGFHPGDALEINEFVQNILGKNVILIVGNCQDPVKKVYGTRCAPMQLKPTFQADNERTGHTLNFEQFQRTGYLPGHYEGALPTEAVYDVSDVGSVGVTEDNGFVYQLPANSTADAMVEFSSLEVPHGSYITLIGGGGTEWAVLSTTNDTVGVTELLLEGGTDWTALSSATITLEVFKYGANTYLIERERG